jgi:hypothetical protein
MTEADVAAVDAHATTIEAARRTLAECTPRRDALRAEVEANDRIFQPKRHELEDLNKQIAAAEKNLNQAKSEMFRLLDVKPA